MCWIQSLNRPGALTERGVGAFDAMSKSPCSLMDCVAKRKNKALIHVIAAESGISAEFQALPLSNFDLLTCGWETLMLYRSISLLISLSLSISLDVSRSNSLLISCDLSLSLSLSPSLSISLDPSQSLSISLNLSQSLSIYLSLPLS